MPSVRRLGSAFRGPKGGFVRKDDVVADTLTEGQKLAKGESITSNNGAYKLILQDDGNLVLYARDHVVWSA